jgi:hypothetical protein
MFQYYTLKKIIIFILLFTASLGYGQNLKGSLKYGGRQDGKPFSITYALMMEGINDPEINISSNSLPAEVKTTVFFNYDNSNKLKVIFSNGKHNILYNIRNIYTRKPNSVGFITEADASHTDVKNGKAEIVFTDRDIQILIVESNKVITFLAPIKN